MREPRREEDHIEPGARGPREHVGNLEADIRRPHPITSDLHHLGCRINRRHRVSQPRQRLRPQAGPARDLQHVSGWPHPRDQSRDTRTSRGNIAIRRRVVLTRPATVVINLISQNLIGHPDIITQRCDRSGWPETQAPATGASSSRPRRGHCTAHPRRPESSPHPRRRGSSARASSGCCDICRPTCSTRPRPSGPTSSGLSTRSPPPTRGLGALRARNPSGYLRGTSLDILGAGGGGDGEDLDRRG
jgi:hypothetical protein